MPTTIRWRDDFVVPGGETWSIDGVDVLGAYFNGSGPADSFNVYFYTDASGLPGTLVDSRMAQPYTNDASAIITLDSPVVLTEGTYWISVQARMDFPIGGQWGWTDRTVTSNTASVFQNPADGLGTGCPTWAAKTVCIPGSDPDTTFRLNGTIGSATTFCNGGADEIFCDGFESVYRDRADFLTQVAAGYFDNPFDDAVRGESVALNYSQGGFAYTVDSTTPDQLFNDTGVISTNFAIDSIVVTFTGDPVTAVGGNFWATDASLVPTGTEVVISLSDGTTEAYTSTGPSDFRGFTTTVPITSITIDASDTGSTYWSTMDNLVVGSGN